MRIGRQERWVVAVVFGQGVEGDRPRGCISDGQRLSYPSVHLTASDWDQEEDGGEGNQGGE